MPRSFRFPGAIRLVRQFGAQVAMSVAVSASVAGVLAAPEYLFGKTQAKVAIAGPDTWVSPVSADGKIGTRHRDAARDDEDRGSYRDLPHVTPASLAMPMSVGWPQAGFAAPVQLAGLAPEPPVRAAVIEASLARKPNLVVERPRLAAVAAPMPIMPAAYVAPAAGIADPDAPRPPANIPGRVMPEPVVRAAGLVSGAVGMVGSAGSWTVSQAAGLLPRW